MKTIEVSNRAEWRAWLAAHHDTVIEEDDDSVTPPSGALTAGESELVPWEPEI